MPTKSKILLKFYYLILGVSVHYEKSNVSKVLSVNQLPYLPVSPASFLCKLERRSRSVLLFNNMPN